MDRDEHAEAVLVDEARLVAGEVFQRYVDRYNGETQGCCPLIADEIQNLIGGEVVGGELTWYGGSCRRTHWWVAIGDNVIDPMGDDFLKDELGIGRFEAHRDRAIFDSILPHYEQWRIESGFSPEPPRQPPLLSA